MNINITLPSLATLWWHPFVFFQIGYKVAGTWRVRLLVIFMMGVMGVCPQMLWHLEYKRWFFFPFGACVLMPVSLLHGVPDESGEARHLSNYCCHIFYEGVGWGGEITRLSMVLWKGTRKLNGRLFSDTLLLLPEAEVNLRCLVVWMH
jgi:hypothetical protein